MTTTGIVIQLCRSRAGAFIRPDDGSRKIYLPFTALEDGQQVLIGARVNFVLGISRIPDRYRRVRYCYPAEIERSITHDS